MFQVSLNSRLLWLIEWFQVWILWVWYLSIIGVLFAWIIVSGTKGAITERLAFLRMIEQRSAFKELFSLSKTLKLFIYISAYFAVTVCYDPIRIFIVWIEEYYRVYLCGQKGMFLCANATGAVPSPKRSYIFAQVFALKSLNGEWQRSCLFVSLRIGWAERQRESKSIVLCVRIQASVEF